MWLDPESQHPYLPHLLMSAEPPAAHNSRKTTISLSNDPTLAHWRRKKSNMRKSRFHSPKDIQRELQINRLQRGAAANHFLPKRVRWRKSCRLLDAVLELATRRSTTRRVTVALRLELSLQANPKSLDSPLQTGQTCLPHPIVLRPNESGAR